MTDKSVSVPQCWKCHCLVKAHHGPTIGCEGAGGNCGCILTQEEASRVSVPTESRPTNEEIEKLANLLRDAAKTAWHDPGETPYWTIAYAAYAYFQSASSSLLPVGCQLCICGLPETADCHKREFALSGVAGSHQFALASLPVGESRCTLTGHLCGTDTVQAGRGNCPDPANKYQCRGSESPEPVAYRVKDFGDGWILHYTLAAARDEADGVGNLIQPLYAHPQPLPKPPELGLGESREPLPNLPDQPSEPMSPASVRVVNSILEARVPESNFLRDEPELSSVPAEIENVSSDVPKSSNETRNI